MIKRRIIWIILILAAAGLYLFSNGTVTMAILASVTATPLASYVMLAVSGRKLTAAASLHEGNEGGKKMYINIRNDSLIPVADIIAEIKCSNLRTGEVWYLQAGVEYTGGCSASHISAAFEPHHTGRYELIVESLVLHDAMRLFRKTVSLEESSAFTQAPEQFEILLDVASSSSAILESDKYSRITHGNDPGEVRGIREYVPGDPVKNIHWKLSEKVEKTMIKELSLPVTDDVLVMLDASGSELTYGQMDVCAMVFVSLIWALLNSETGLSVGWREAERRNYVIRKINDADEAAKAMEEYLSVPAYLDDFSGRFEDILAGGRFAHIVIICASVPSGVTVLASGCQVTALVCGHAGASCSDGVRIMGFDEADAETTFAYMKI